MPVTLSHILDKRETCGAYEINPKIIVFDEVEWLHVRKESLGEHASCQAPPILYPRGIDEFSFRHMHWEVVNDHTTFPHVIHVNLILKSLPDNGLMLSTIELIKHIRSVALKWLSQIMLRQATLHAIYFGHEVYD